ncbi:MAG: hypothetical protein LH606_08600 [Cytophagaceae bacterium]|nr:hypothetical protein [Cytophagaceae bacterium]
MSFELLKKRFRQARYLSLDVALGAVLSAWAVWKLSDGHHSPSALSLVVLGLTVFVIYALDRLLDVRKTDQPTTPRHAFHAQHQRILWQILVGVAAIAFGLSYLIPSAVAFFGLKLMGLVAVYLFIVSRLPYRNAAQYAKEPVTALLYVAGIWGPVFAVHPPGSWVDWTLCAIFGGVVVQNLLLFSLYEARLVPGANNLSTWWGPDFSGDVLMVVFLLVSVGGVFTGIWADFPYQRRMSLVIWAMSGMLWSMSFRKDFFARNERYRWLGDGVFLLMGLLL